MNPLAAILITMGICSGCLLLTLGTGGNKKERVKEELQEILKYNYFKTYKEAEEAKEILRAIFPNEPFEFKTDWTQSETDFVTVSQIKERIKI